PPDDPVAVEVPDEFAIDLDDIYIPTGFDSALSFDIDPAPGMVWSVDDEKLVTVFNEVDWQRIPDDGDRFGAVKGLVWTPDRGVVEAHLEHTRSPGEDKGSSVHRWSEPPDNHLHLTETLTGKINRRGDDVAPIQSVRQVLAVFLAGRDDGTQKRSVIVPRPGVTFVGTEAPDLPAPDPVPNEPVDMPPAGGDTGGDDPVPDAPPLPPVEPEPAPEPPPERPRRSWWQELLRRWLGGGR
ncbi:MAG: hypothetical protein ACPGVG_18925, partial [Mycobacterium sp.]